MTRPCDDLIQIRHVPKTGKDTAMELIVGQRDDGHQRVAKIVGQIEHEAAVVDEDGVQGLVKQLLRGGPFKLIEPQTQELFFFLVGDPFSGFSTNLAMVLQNFCRRAGQGVGLVVATQGPVTTAGERREWGRAKKIKNINIKYKNK